MDIYELPKFQFPKIKAIRKEKLRTIQIIIGIVLLSSFFGFLAGLVSGSYFYLEIKDYLSKLNIELPGVKTIIEKEYVPQTTQEEAIVNAVKTVSPVVVSIVATRDVPIFEEYYINPFQQFEELFGQGAPFLQVPQYRQKGTEKQEVSGGTGFFVSAEGMIITNRHVVLDTEADYTVFTNDGKSYPAKVLARDSSQDLAVIKIDQEKAVNSEGKLEVKSFPTVKLGDSDKVQIGQTVIAIGNALGEFRNTVSVGVVSGLGRQITASGGSFVETLEDVIQTDAAINLGNSGGPLLNLAGEVIGINTAVVQEAQSIGFAIPINKAKRDIEQVKTSGKIVYAFLGIRYIIINESIQKENNLPVSYGAWIVKGEGGTSAVYPDSAAEKAGLQENDILLEFDGEKIATDNSLARIIQNYLPEDKVSLKYLRDGKEQTVYATLDERTE